MIASPTVIQRRTPLDARAIRAQFPIFAERSGEPRLAYLDSAASSQKPDAVLEAMEHYYREDYANVHRGVYKLAERSTEAYDEARRRVARFFAVPDPRQIVFVRNTTEAINLFAYSWGLSSLRQGDVVVLSEMEHHSNLVPWQFVAARTGATLEFMRVDGAGTLVLEDLDTFLARGNVRLVATCHVSNMLGTVNPVEEIIARSHAAGALVLLDGAQSAPHLAVDLPALDVDFYACSGHKMCGPMGSGVLFGRRELLDSMPTFLGGGDMIRVVQLRESTWADVPAKFEAGTPSVADAVGLGAACDYLSAITLDAVHAHERALTMYAVQRLDELPGLTIYGPAADERAGVISFNLVGVHPHDIGSILDEHGVCIRAGHHCTQPLHARLGLDASARASFYVYNTFDDVDQLVDGLRHVQTIFGRPGA